MSSGMCFFSVVQTSPGVTDFLLAGWAQVFRSDAEREDAKHWDGVGPSCCKIHALSRWDTGVLTVGRDIKTSKHR